MLVNTLLQTMSSSVPVSYTHLDVYKRQNLGCEGMICQQSWPVYDESKTVAATVELAVQIGGKMRGNVQVPTDAEQDVVVAAVLADAKLAKYTEGMDIVKVILVKNRLVNLILKPKA